MFSLKWRRNQTCFILQANYTFYFVDKLKILSETLLKISSVFPSGGNGQMLEQLQVRAAHFVTEGRGGMPRCASSQSGLQEVLWSPRAWFP